MGGERAEIRASSIHYLVRLGHLILSGARNLLVTVTTSKVTNSMSLNFIVEIVRFFELALVGTAHTPRLTVQGVLC